MDDLIEEIKLFLFRDPDGGLRVDIMCSHPVIAILAMANAISTLSEKIQPIPDEPSRIITVEKR